MPKQRKRARKPPRSPHEVRSFGSGLDEVGWKPTSKSRRLKPRLEKTVEQVRIEFERALSAIAAERRFLGTDILSAELEILDEATKIVKKVLSEPK